MNAASTRGARPAASFLRTTFATLLLFLTSLAAQAADLFSAPVSGHNYTLKLAVTAARIQSTYAEESAPEGHRFLVLQTTWTNVIDPALAEKRALPLRALNDNLHESLSLLLDGKEVVFAEVRATDTRNLDPENKEMVGDSGGSTGAAYIRPVVGLKNEKGKRSLAFVELAKPGDTLSGEVLFAIPAATFNNAELVFSDPTGGQLRLQLTGKPVAALAPAHVQTNQVLALSASLVAAAPSVPPPPPPGRRWVIVDLAGKSLLKVKDKVPPYDPTHEPEEEYWRPDPAGWMEFRDNVQITADGALPCGLDAVCDAPAEAEFSPELWHTYRLIFLAPAEARSLELVCYFPNYTVPGIEGEVSPKPMRFLLFGPASPFPSPPAKTELKIVDGPVECYVLDHRVQPKFADSETLPEEQFLVVAFQLRNTGTEGEEFKAPEQLVWFNAGTEMPPDEASTRGSLTPPAYFHLEPGAAYNFDVAWRIPAKLGKAEMGFKGNTKAEKFTLSIKP